MERLNESQVRAQAVRLFKENCYSYSVIAKKTSCHVAKSQNYVVWDSQEHSIPREPQMTVSDFRYREKLLQEG